VRPGIEILVRASEPERLGIEPGIQEPEPAESFRLDSERAEGRREASLSLRTPLVPVYYTAPGPETEPLELGLEPPDLFGLFQVAFRLTLILRRPSRAGPGECRSAAQLAGCWEVPSPGPSPVVPPALTLWHSGCVL
jgi:hypothetical protein